MCLLSMPSPAARIGIMSVNFWRDGGGSGGLGYFHRRRGPGRRRPVLYVIPRNSLLNPAGRLGSPAVLEMFGTAVTSRAEVIYRVRNGDFGYEQFTAREGTKTVNVLALLGRPKMRAIVISFFF
jgi:hypothetical protein